MDRILITAPVRQENEILRKYLNSLNELYVDNSKFRIDKYFILHNCYYELINEFQNGEFIERLDDDTYYVKSEKTHIWRKNILNRMSEMKNRIVKYALENNYDYIFWVDSDIILQRNTLVHLYNTLKKYNEHIISEILWTEFQKGSGKLEPNCWETDFYTYPENYYKPNKIYQVGGMGGISLVDTEVYKKGVNYSPLPNLPITNWEDRAFCIRATCHEFKILMDTHYEATHLY